MQESYDPYPIVPFTRRQCPHAGERRFPSDHFLDCYCCTGPVCDHDERCMLVTQPWPTKEGVKE